jgi:AraC-like DNA-binding protein
VPKGFCTASDILLFYHDYSFNSGTIHSRYTLVIPFTELIYTIEKKEYLLNINDALFIKPYLHRAVPDLYPDYSRLIITFDFNSPQGYLPEEPVMTISDDAWQLISKLLEAYKKEDNIVSSLTLTLLLCELSQATSGECSIQYSEKVYQAINLINQYVGEYHAIKTLARQLDVSPNYLSKLFLDEVGMTLGKYIKRNRLNLAQRLLIETSYSIDEIAKRCAYDTIFSFSRFFKKESGLSPSEFRKRNHLLK